jgi:protein-tyrosine phosphatase
LIDQGCWVQLTAGSLVGQFGSKAQACAQTLLDEQWATVVASDAHNLTGRRPMMRAAAQWLATHYGAAAAQQLTVLAPARLAGLPQPTTAAA